MLGKDFYANEKECKQDIGVVFGGIDFYPLKKLSAITAVTRRFYKDWDQERYNDYLRQFSLDENKQFRSLSNGMKVKYLLALALSHHATLYLLDEPTSGLDPVSRDEILHIFTRIVKTESDPSCFPPILLLIWIDVLMTSPISKTERSCRVQTKIHFCIHLST